MTVFSNIMDYEEADGDSLKEATAYLAQHRNDAFVKNISVVCSAVVTAAQAHS